MATKQKNIVIEIPDIETDNKEIHIVGQTPLICHAWSDDSIKKIYDKLSKKASNGKDSFAPMIEYAETLYWIEGKPDSYEGMEVDEIYEATQKGTFGFPGTAFKKAAIDAGYQTNALDKKTTARNAFHVSVGMVEIKGKPSMREDMCRIQGKGHIRYRAEFKEWECFIPICYNVKVMSFEQIVCLFNIAGFGVGIGDWRPEKNGTFGRFKVA